MDCSLSLNIISGTINSKYLSKVKNDFNISKDSRVCFTFTVDGCNKPYSTSSTNISESFTLNYPLHISFTCEAIENCYMYTSLYLEDSSKNTDAISRSKTRINKMPLNGSPFTLPLMNKGQQVATISLTCVLEKTCSTFIHYPAIYAQEDYPNPYLALEK